MYTLPMQTGLDSVSPEQLNQTVDQLSESTLALAEAAANFGALKVIFAAFIVFTFILILLFLYQVVITTRKVEKIHQSTQRLEKTLSETEDRTIGRTQANLMIRRVFGGLKQSIKYAILRIRLENHLDMKDVITSKVTRLVNNHWVEMHSFLSNFDCEGKNLGSNVRDGDAQTIVDFILDQVYQSNDVFTVGSMEQSTDILIDGMRLDSLKDYN